MKEEIAIFSRKKKIKLTVKRTGFFTKGIGLMFRTAKTDKLLFEFKKDTLASITSIFVFFPFLAIWLDEKNNVLEKRIVRPFIFAIRPQKKFRKLVEVPLNHKNRQIIDFFVEKRRKV
ncbi:hypothetical protein COU60_04975 [Candidatus Pacearchaeota archaeon CG10_big_fil_rev_8_21_14_0_10_34_76]|nr:MAG: hypothetical protein COU60_04975 [Candidatus Pacearchaeota archaeon CG10_big_fil_rev_8_21_14_0_10_34_76]